MTRPLRIEFEGAWYHVMNRGLNHQLIYLKDAHYQAFLELLADIHQQFCVQIHAYCLMDNHYHLLLHTPLGNLSRAMRHLDGLYTQKFNKSENRDGPLFRGRYKSILIDNDSYLLQLSRYIHLNPIAAQLVTHAEDYRYSSYKAYLQRTTCPAWLYCDEVLAFFSKNEAAEQYKNFTQEGVDQEILEVFSKMCLPSILGNESFVNRIKNSKIPRPINDPEIPAAKILNNLPNLDMILQHIINHYGLERTDIMRRGNRAAKNHIRNLIIYFLSTYFDFKLQDIAEQIGGTSYNGISKVKRRMHSVVESNPSYQEELEKLRQLISS
jgi:putative transposase